MKDIDNLKGTRQAPVGKASYSCGAVSMRHRPLAPRNPRECRLSTKRSHSAPSAASRTGRFPKEPLNKSRSPSAPPFAGGDGVAAMGSQAAARRGFRSPHAAGRPSGGPKQSARRGAPFGRA